MEIRHYVLLPHSAAAMQLYSLMNAQGFACTPVPTPRTADHCCGISILYENTALQPAIQKLAEDANIPIDAFYEVANTDDPSRMKFC